MTRRRQTRWVRRSTTGAALLLVALCLGACEGCDETNGPAPTTSAKPPAGLTPEQAAQVLAKVGDRTITLGDYAATLERMNRFDRLRYQTDERREQLLEEMIEVELLAAEARRRGIDERPEVRAAMRQVLREAMVARTLQELPAPSEIAASEVKAYYEAHRDDFVEPERRRVAAIQVTDRPTADEVLAKLKSDPSGANWGELFWGYSFSRPDKRPAHAPADLAGDLGIVGPPGVEGASHAEVPEPVREAVFELKAVGDVAPELVEANTRFYIVRLVGLSAGHTRSPEEADRSIRIAILQEKRIELEKKLEAELRARFPVSVDEAALAAVEVPTPGASAVPSAVPSSSASAPAPSASGAP